MRNVWTGQGVTAETDVLVSEGHQSSPVSLRRAPPAGRWGCVHLWGPRTGQWRVSGPEDTREETFFFSDKLVVHSGKCFAIIGVRTEPLLLHSHVNTDSTGTVDHLNANSGKESYTIGTDLVTQKQIKQLKGQDQNTTLRVTVCLQQRLLGLHLEFF